MSPTSTTSPSPSKAKTLILLVISDNQYQDWQSRVFHYHMKKLLLPDQELMTLISAPGRKVDLEAKCAEEHNNCPLFPTGDYTTAPNGDVFVVYNRAHAIREFMDSFDGKGFETVVIVEPDMLPLKPITVKATKGEILGHHYFYMEREYGGAELNQSALIDYCSFNPDQVEPIGVPYVLHIDDLRNMLPLWIEKTIKMRIPQPWLSGDQKGERSWIADMWSFACAAADLNIKSIASPTFGPETAIDPTPGDDSLFIHYTYGYTFGDFKFEKRDWTSQPPQPRPFPASPSDAPNEIESIHLSMLNEALVAIFGPTN